MLCLGEDMRLPQEERGLCLGEGVRLGEDMYAYKPQDKKWRVFSPHRQGFCSPRRTTSLRRR